MKKRIIKYFFGTITIGFSLTLLNANAALPARFTADGYGSTDYVVGRADLMLPLKGDAWHNFYIDPVFAYGSDAQGYADLGLGYRWVKNNSAILGGYLFGGYSRIDNNSRLWVVNPGIEALGSRWDAHLNGYLVMGDRNQKVSNFLTFDQFSGHSGLFYLFDVTQHAGDGVDVKLGYQLFPKTPLKAYVGSYFFSPSATNNVLGGAVGLEYWFDQRIKIFAGYTYDNLRRSVGALGLGVEFGGTHVHRSDPSVEERITDPVERYLAELGRGSAIPSQKKAQLVGLVVPARLNDIVFFSLTGTPNNGGMGLTLANCTFENPCGPTDLTNQGTTTLETLLPNTMIYFEGGTYSALNVVGGTSPVTIRTGQSINSLPGTSPSTFTGGFILEGNNSLNDIILVSTTSTATGAGVSASGSNVAINGSQIGSMATPFAIGLSLSGNTQADLNDSTVSASSLGVNTSGSASLTTNASMINVNGGANSFGINSTSSGPTNFTNASSINVNATGANSLGYFDTGSGAVNFSGGSSINVNSSAPVAIGYAHLGSSDVNFSGGSSINVNAPGQDMVAGFGDGAGASGDVTFDASSVNVIGADDTIGLMSEGTGSLNIINNSAVNVTGGNDSFGLEATGGTVNLNSSLVNLQGTGTLVGIDADNASVTGSNVNVIVATDNADQATGLATGGTGTITFNGIDIDVSGNPSSLISDVGGGPIMLTGTNVCMLNGNPVAC